MWPGILNFAYAHCPTVYVLHMICSHFYPPPLLCEFDRIASEGVKIDVYNDVVVLQCGHIVYQAFMRHVSTVCVCCKKFIIDFERTKIHDELGIVFDEKNMVRLRADNSNFLCLFQDKSCFSLTSKTIKYAEIETRQRIKRGEKTDLWLDFSRR